MCRKNHLWGWALVAFGLGTLVGRCFDSGFISFTVSVCVIAFGCHVMRQK